MTNGRCRRTMPISVEALRSRMMGRLVTLEALAQHFKCSVLLVRQSIDATRAKLEVWDERQRELVWTPIVRSGDRRLTWNTKPAPKGRG